MVSNVNVACARLIETLISSCKGWPLLVCTIGVKRLTVILLRGVYLLYNVSLFPLCAVLALLADIPCCCIVLFLWCLYVSSSWFWLLHDFVVLYLVWQQISHGFACRLCWALLFVYSRWSHRWCFFIENMW